MVFSLLFPAWAREEPVLSGRLKAWITRPGKR
ncbi:hypothetical protein TNMX_07265 [Thermus sp. NMX2.A1]|nr:hypothetical protein TNMX_07265 [Thermus sp. NMX2.A1]